MMLPHKNITYWDSRELRIGGSLSFSSSSIPYDVLNHLTGCKKTSIATGEYPCYAFVLMSLDGNALRA